MGPFALYTTADCQPAARVTAGQAFDLTQPINAGGATLFRHSLWMPLSAAALQADALRLAAGAALAFRFTALELSVSISDPAWVKERTLGADTVSLTLALPVPLVRVDGHGTGPIDVFRRDGKVLGSEAVVSGSLNGYLPTAFVGSSFAVKYPLVVADRFQRFEAVAQAQVQTGIRTRAMAVQGAGSLMEGAGAVFGEVVEIDTLSTLRLNIVSSLRLAGKPTSPRIRLVLPAAGNTPEQLLWMDLLPGEQTSAPLPATVDIAGAWEPAFGQVKAAATAPTATGLALRLDLESDTPCRVTLQAVSLALEADTELLAAPQTLRFSGMQNETLPVTLSAAAGPVRRVAVEATLVDDPGAAAASGAGLPGDGRTGVLLDADRWIVRALELGTPTRLVGVSLPWRPLSDAVQWVIQVFADGGEAPAARPLLEARLNGETSDASWVALRWPAIDLQAGRCWLRLGVAAGSGVWLGDPSGAAVPGWVEAAAAAATHMPLGLAPSAALLAGANTETGPTATQVAMRIGSQTLTVTRVTPSAPARAKLQADARQTSDFALAANTLSVGCAQPLSLKIESVTVTRLL